MFNTKETCQWVTHREYSSFSRLRSIPDFINEFGAHGGFDKILDLMKGKLNKTVLSMTHINYLVEFLSKIYSLFTRQYVILFTPKIKDAFQSAIMSGSLKSSFNKDHLTSAQSNFEKILKRYYPSAPSGSTIKSLDDNYHLIASDAAFCIACTLLKSEKLEQRVSGLSQINT
jgi:hypothetical protein